MLYSMAVVPFHRRREVCNMKDKESPDLGKPFIIYAYPGSFFFVLGMLCVCVCICSVFFMILFRQLGGYLIAALVSAAGALLFRWLGNRQPESREKLIEISARGISLPERGMAKAAHIPWERFSSATERSGVHQYPALVIEYRDPASFKLRTVERSLEKCRCSAGEIIEIIERYRDQYWATRKKGPTP